MGDGLSRRHSPKGGTPAASKPQTPESRQARSAQVPLRAEEAMRAMQDSMGNARVGRMLGTSPPRIQRMAGHGQATKRRALSRGLSSAIRSGGGQPLQGATRNVMETALGADLGGVRVHTGAQADRAARDINARAFTAGQDIYFAADQYRTGTQEGNKLLVHELVHTVQQRNGAKAVAVSRPADPDEQEADRVADTLSGECSGCQGSEPCSKCADIGTVHRAAASADTHRPPLLQRKPNEGASSGEPAAFDPKKELESELSALDKHISEVASINAASDIRLKLLLQSAKPDWPDKEAFDSFYDQCSETALDEKKTIDELGDPDRTNPEAFPETWSNELGKHLTMSYPLYQVQKDVEADRGEMEKIGAGIPDEILAHGLPVGFAASMDLKEFQLSSALGVSFVWIAQPAGAVFVTSGPLATFTVHALKYLHALNEADVINLWIQDARSVVQQVKDAELSVDPEAFDRYKEKRPHGVPPDEISRTQAAIPEPLSGRIDPAIAESYVTNIAGLVAFGRSFLHADEIAAIGNRFIAQADARIADENPVLRQMRAGRWGHEQGFYGAAIDREWKDIKEHAVEIGLDIGKEAVKFTILEAIPVVNVIATVYYGLQLVKDVASTLTDMASADEEARDAKTAAELQRAAAHQAAALSSAARQVAMAIATHYATKAAKGAHKWIKGEGGGAGQEATRVPEDPAKAQEKAKQQAETEKQAAREPATEPIQGEPEKLPNGGEAIVTEEGHCKICQSPCQFEVDMARNVLDATAGTPYRGYAENLFKRIQLLDEAMEASTRRGTMKDEFAPRFAGAFKKLSSEVQASHRVFVDLVKGARHPAAEAIKGFESSRQHGFMEDPSRYEFTPKAERMREGTAYHERIEDAVAASLPRNRVLTENTVRDYFLNMGFNPNMLPAKSTGIDLYVIDSVRGVATPVDIAHVAGARQHVAKLHEDVGSMRSLFRQVGLKMTEPIEIEYVGMTINEAVASIVAELRAFAD
jgi:hypothetical protein